MASGRNRTQATNGWRQALSPLGYLCFKLFYSLSIFIIYPWSPYSSFIIPIAEFFWLTADQSPCFHLGGHLDSKQEETFSGLDEGLHSSLLTFLLDKSTHQMSRDFCPYPHELEHWECKIRYLGQIPAKAKTEYAILHQMFFLSLRRWNMKIQILRAIYDRDFPWTN